MRYIGNKGRPDARNGAPITLTNPSAGQRCTRPCSNRHDCPTDRDYLCVASNGSFADPRLLSGCCKLSYNSQSSHGEQLLRNESVAQGSKPAQAGNIALPPFPVSDFGCACNCTYVSQSCCGVESGLILESASLKQGVLEPPNSTACCDVNSGSFSQGPRNIKSLYC